MNMSGIDGESLAGGALIYTTCFKETSTLAASVDGIDGNGGGDGWHTRASTLDGCDGRGGAGEWPMGATTKDALNMKDGGDGR
jgi:hypothetical protein